MKQSEKITKYDYEIELIRSDRRTIALQVYPDGRIVCRAPRGDLRMPSDAVWEIWKKNLENCENIVS